MKSVLVGGRQSQKIEQIPLGVDPLSVETEFVDLNSKDEALRPWTPFTPFPRSTNLTFFNCFGTSVDEVKETKLKDRNQF